MKNTLTYTDYLENLAGAKTGTEIYQKWSDKQDELLLDFIKDIPEYKIHLEIRKMKNVINEQSILINELKERINKYERI